MEKFTSCGMICMWCRLHHTELIMHRVYKQDIYNEYLATLTLLIRHFPHQQNFILKDLRMNIIWPKVANYEVVVDETEK